MVMSPVLAVRVWAGAIEVTLVTLTAIGRVGEGAVITRGTCI